MLYLFILFHFYF